MAEWSELQKKLWGKASEVRKNAYAPYSKFLVGAALESDEGNVFTGCNFENACFPAGICAERVALGKGISEGFKKFRRIAIVADGHGKVVPPCGMCLQAMSEFLLPDAEIILCNPRRIERTYKLVELLPTMYTADML